MIINFDKRGGGSGASSYADLSNKPKVNNVELSGNKTSSQLGVVEEAPNDNKQYARKDKAWVEVQGGSSSVTVEDNLNSDSSTNALSANQGKVLNGKVGDLTTTVTSMGTAVTELSGNVTDLEQNQGDLDDLDTTATDLVGAVNEVKGIADGKADKVSVASSIPAGGLLPNVRYNLGTISSTTTISLATATDLTHLNEYMFRFSVGSSVPTITLPTGVVYGKSKESVPPTLEANTGYEFSIVDGWALYESFDLS